MLRAGRITAAQKRALEELLPRYGIPFAPAPLDLDRTFGRSAPRVLSANNRGGSAFARSIVANAASRSSCTCSVAYSW